MCKKGNNSNPSLLNVLIPEKVPLISKTSLESMLMTDIGCVRHTCTS